MAPVDGCRRAVQGEVSAHDAITSLLYKMLSRAC